ncbi:DUF58 domain-containing protein [Halovenus rubra]|uniref:DUF58 domain-containing protein n=2 Tax=Halovenus rubra TaxID=869890 RepID=A0ACC7DXS1_9EURY|nr:DUF58 domain-containing protein [Halovenus rubra]
MSTTQHRTEQKERTELSDGENENETINQSPRVRHIASHSTGRWKVVGGGAILAAGVSILARVPALLLVCVMAVGMLTVRQLSSVPNPEVTVSRSLSPVDPDPGETVTVETTIKNVGERSLPDCRFIAGVPDELRVSNGTPRLATRLAPGEECTFSYDIKAEGGTHKFEDIYLILSDAVGATEHEYKLGVHQRLDCRRNPSPLQVPVLRSVTTPYAGRLSTEQPGEGLEFFAVREYRTGDPLKRIDWNQYASSKQLATLQFRTERSASVVILVDVRKDAYVRTDPEDNHVVERGIEAAGRALVTLLDEDHQVGLATLGPPFWLAPSDGTNHRNRALDALSCNPVFSSTPPDEEYPTRLRTLELLQRLTEPTQVIICTPLVDDRVELPLQMLESDGHEVTVLSPNPAEMDTRGGIVATLERQQRVSRIHGYGIPVIDWDTDTPLETTVAQTMHGWSK